MSSSSAMAGPSGNKRKRSKQWDYLETQILVQKWSEENIQNKLKSCTRKKEIWDEISIYLKAEGYEDRDSESCKMRIKTLVAAYRNYKDNRDITGNAATRKPTAFDELDAILCDKPTTTPSFTITSIEQDTSLHVPIAEEYVEIADEEVDNTSASSDDLLFNANQAIDEVKLKRNEKIQKFMFNKNKKRKSNIDQIFEKLNEQRIQYMQMQKEADNDFFFKAVKPK